MNNLKVGDLVYHESWNGLVGIVREIHMTNRSETAKVFTQLGSEVLVQIDELTKAEAPVGSEPKQPHMDIALNLRRGSRAYKIFKYMKPKEVYSPFEFNLIGNHPIAQSDAPLFREPAGILRYMAKKGILVRVGHGQYMLTDKAITLKNQLEIH